jgi:hypothetical protein
MPIAIVDVKIFVARHVLIRMWENVVPIKPHFLGLLICGVPLFVPK